MPKSLFFAWADLDWIPVDANTRRKQIWLDNIMHVMVELKAGTTAPAHSHPHEQTGIILQGTLKVTVGDQEKTLPTGAGYLVPPNMVHGVQVIGDEDVLILDTFTPIREDFLK